MNCGSRTLGLVAALVLVLTPALSATVTIPTEFREIVADAALVVRGHVTDVRSLVVRDRGVESIATIAIEAVLKGRAQDFVSIAVPGGTIGRYSWRVQGAPILRVGQRAIFFLKRDSNNSWRPVGLTLGVYPVQLAPVTRLAVVNAPVLFGVTTSAGRVVRGDARRRAIPVAEFDDLVRLVAAGRSVSASAAGRVR